MPEHPACTRTPNPLDEFGVISRFFTDRSFYPSAWPSQGAGDDCAFLDIGPMRLAVTADMMALGIAFFRKCFSLHGRPQSACCEFIRSCRGRFRAESIFPLYFPASHRRELVGRFFQRSSGRGPGALTVRCAAETPLNRSSGRGRRLIPPSLLLRWANCRPAKD